MKLTLALLSSAFAAAASTTVEVQNIKADSKFGMKVLSQARKLEQNDDAQGDQTWIANMSLKFEGCHHISQWNADADNADDVRIETKRLAKFRLCPTDSCSSGCKKGYGDYITDMDQFLAAYLENKEEVQEAACESYLENKCNCANGYYDNSKYYNEQQCENACYNKAGMDYCIEQENNGDDGNAEQFELNNYLECSQYQPQNNRRLYYGQNNGYYQGEQEYYIGTACSSQGGSVVLGMFTDDACTNYADSNGGRTTYYELEGQSLPYSEESIVDNGCWSCEEAQENDNGNYYAQAEPKEICTDVYASAGKCETNIDNYYYDKNENGCAYMKGIKTTSSSGIINSGNNGGNKVASAFIGIFSLSFVALGSYVYYLKTKLDRGRINLSD